MGIALDRPGAPVSFFGTADFPDRVRTPASVKQALAGPRSEQAMSERFPVNSAALGNGSVPKCSKTRAWSSFFAGIRLAASVMTRRLDAGRAEPSCQPEAWRRLKLAKRVTAARGAQPRSSEPATRHAAAAFAARRVRTDV